MSTVAPTHPPPPFTSRVRFEQSSQQSDEGSLSRPILPQHHNDLRVSELTLLNVQVELPHTLRHRRVAIAT